MKFKIFLERVAILLMIVWLLSGIAIVYYPNIRAMEADLGETFSAIVLLTFSLAWMFGFLLLFNKRA